MKIAAYQAPLGSCHSLEIVHLIREQIRECESLGIDFLCCPEGALGGLADYCDGPASIAINVERGGLADAVAAFKSDTVTTIVGFTEVDAEGVLYNAAAVVHRGRVAGVYRKQHPAINRSVYAAGTASPVFTIGELTFGILICRDSIFAEPAQSMAEQGATVLFIPTNNGLPAHKASAALVDDARRCDARLAIANKVSIVRADVVGECGGLVSYGSSEIMDSSGAVVASLRPSSAGLIVATLVIPTERSDEGSSVSGRDGCHPDGAQRRGI